MRITINQASLDRHYERAEISHLSARPSQSTTTVEQIATLALQLGVPLREIGTVELEPATSRDHVGGKSVVRLALV